MFRTYFSTNQSFGKIIVCLNTKSIKIVNSYLLVSRNFEKFLFRYAGQQRFSVSEEKLILTELLIFGLWLLPVEHLKLLATTTYFLRIRNGSRKISYLWSMQSSVLSVIKIRLISTRKKFIYLNLS